MKKILNVFISSMLCFTLTACTDNKSKNEVLQNNKDAIFLEPTVLSDEQEKILTLFSDEVVLYDLVIDDTVKSYSMTLWTYRDHKWQELSSGQSNIEGSKGNPYLIGLKVDGENFDYSLTASNGNSQKTSGQDSSLKFDPDFITARYFIQNHIDVEINKEITLWAKVSTNKSGGILAGDDFRNSKCEQGFAVTLTLYDEKLEIE